jgi:hypothetical protein
MQSTAKSRKCLASLLNVLKGRGGSLDISMPRPRDGPPGEKLTVNVTAPPNTDWPQIAEWTHSMLPF